MTASDIILRWIERRANGLENFFASYDLEAEVPVYGRLAHQKVHTPSTYSRAFRKIREENTLRRYGLELEEHVNKDTKVKGWKIKKLS
jgi:hypothetical protein